MQKTESPSNIFSLIERMAIIIANAKNKTHLHLSMETTYAVL